MDLSKIFWWKNKIPIVFMFYGGNGPLFDEITEKIEAMGGLVAHKDLGARKNRTLKSMVHLVFPDADISSIKYPVIRHDYINDCYRARRVLDITPYLTEREDNEENATDLPPVVLWNYYKSID